MNKNISLVLFILSFTNPFLFIRGDELLDSLNGMHQLMTGEKDSFDKSFYNELVPCIEQYGVKLLDVVNSQWSGFKVYASNGGNPGVDDWIGCDTRHFLEHNCTVQEYGEIPIWEPCNYASNVAYYHTFVEICHHEGWSLPEEAVSSLGKVFAWPGATSSWMHGSLTTNGLFLDQRSNDLFAYVTYQEMVNDLKNGNESIIHDLSYYKRKHKAATLVELGMDMFLNSPIEEWGFILKDGDFPTSVTTYCSFVMTAMTLGFEEEVVDELVKIVVAIAGDKLPLEIKEFCLDTFLPEIRNSTSMLRPLPEDERSKFVGNFLGTLIKLGYGGIWEEGILPKLFQIPLLNKLGAALLPIINEIATSLNTFVYFNKEFQQGKNFYPGEVTCNDWNPHTRWHLETSIGLPDFVFLADEIHRLIAQANIRSN